MSELKARLVDDMKTAMKAGEKDRLTTIRLLLAAIKQKEVDDRKDLDDGDVLAILTKQAKQRRESIAQYEAAGRDDLIAVEAFELTIIDQYLPQPLSEDELRGIVADALSETGASGMAQMGQVMNIVRAKAAGRADMGLVSKLVKDALSN